MCWCWMGEGRSLNPMPSLPTHTIVGLKLGQAAPAESRREWKFWVLAIGCSVLPDFDVIGFGFGIPYGGLGIAFFSPFDTTRYFFPWRPIQVSPIGIGGFFSARGASILFSETIYVWMPAAIVGLALFNWRWSQESGKPQP